MVLLENLPPESAFMRAKGAWTLDQHLLASVTDAVWGANWQRGGGKGPKPKPIPRPGDKPDTKVYKATPMTLEEAFAFRARQQGRDPEEFLNRKAVTDGS